MTAFVLQGQSCVVETEGTWPAKVKVFTIWPSVEILSNSWERIEYTEPGIFRGHRREEGEGT